SSLRGSRCACNFNAPPLLKTALCLAADSSIPGQVIRSAVVAALTVLGVHSLHGEEPAKATVSANFIDVAEKAGLKMVNVFGGKYTKKYIIETTGTGVAIFDYDNDGWPDIFIVNGTTLEGNIKPAPTNHLYRNKHDGTFEDVTAAADLTATGWGQGACVGDFD